MNSGSSIEDTSVATGMERAALGLRVFPETELSSPRDSVLATPEEKPQQAEDKDKGAQSHTRMQTQLRGITHDSVCIIRFSGELGHMVRTSHRHYVAGALEVRL